MLVWIALLACSVEPASVTEEAPAPRREKAEPASGPVLPLLGVRVDDPPRMVKGLRADPASPGDFVLDGRLYSWGGPSIRDGRVRYGEDREIERAVLNATGRRRCENLLEHVETLYGPPAVAGCSERQWQTPTHAVRYQERPERASCAVSLLVSGTFDPPEAPVAALADGAWGGVALGTAPDAHEGLVAVGESREGVFTGPGPQLPGLATHGIEYRFHDGVLAEVSVRAITDGCEALRARLLEAFGPGTEGSGRDLDWRGCEASVEYRYSAVFQACRATLASPALRWQQAEAALKEPEP